MTPEPPLVEHELTFTLRNVQNRVVNLILEPWGAVHPMPPGAVFEIRAQGPAGETLEIEWDVDRITLWGWAGSAVTVFCNGVELGTIGNAPCPRVPATLAGMSVRTFLRGVLGQSEPPEPPEVN